MGATIERDGLEALVRKVGRCLKDILNDAARSHPEFVCNVRGVGTILAFDCRTPTLRDELVALLRNNGVLVGTNGTRSIRFRPALTFGSAQVSEFHAVFRAVLERLSVHAE